jgi:mono/diheme cytochrome c family protein
MNEPTSRLPASAVNETEPTATKENAPVWLFVLLGGIFFTAALYSDRRSANFDSTVYEPYPSAKYIVDIQPKGDDGGYKRGAKIYSDLCLACHMATGSGNAGQAPPLAGSEWVLAPKPDRIIRIAYNGLAGPVQVLGQTWTLAMPNIGEAANLSNEDFAALMTYIRNSWGNKASIVTPEQVAAARKDFTSHGKPWTVGDLQAIPVE